MRRGVSLQSFRVRAPCCPRPGLQEEEETFYDAMKRDLAERAAKTKAALDALDPATRVAMEVGAAPPRLGLSLPPPRSIASLGAAR